MEIMEIMEKHRDEIIASSVDKFMYCSSPVSDEAKAYYEARVDAYMMGAIKMAELLAPHILEWRPVGEMPKRLHGELLERMRYEFDRFSKMETNLDDTHEQMYYEGFRTAIESEEVQRLVKMLKIHNNLLRKTVEDKGGVYEGYLAKNTAKALKPFEEEGEE